MRIEKNVKEKMFHTMTGLALLGVVALVGCSKEPRAATKEAVAMQEKATAQEILHVPDFIAQLIATQQGSDAQKNAMRQLAAAYWNAIQLTESSSDAMWLNAYGRIVDADACVSSQYEGARAKAVLDTIKSAMVQTPEQQNKMAHMAGLVGKYRVTVAPTGTGCVVQQDVVQGVSSSAASAPSSGVASAPVAAASQASSQ